MEAVPGTRPSQRGGTKPEEKERLRGDDQIGATVNGEAILNEEVYATAFQALQGARGLPEPERTQKINEVWNQSLTQLVEREVVLQDAFGRLQGKGDAFLKKLKEAAAKEFDRQWVRAIMQSTNVKNDRELKEFLRSQGMSLEMVRRQWERNFMAMEYLRSRVFSVLEHRIGHVEMQEYYDRHPEEFKIDDGAQQEMKRIVAKLKREAIIEYANKQ